MGINITEIGQKVLDNNTNAANVFRKMYDLYYNPNPLDVPFEYIDEDGNKVTTNIPNKTKDKKTYLDIIGAAIAKMNVTFYVDGQNGDDLNPGTSDSPFKTLWKACSAIPFGGRGTIILLNDLELANEPAAIRIGGKNIFLKLNGYTLSKTNTNNVLYAADFLTYIKIANGNTDAEANIVIRNDDSVFGTRLGLLSVVDGSATIVIGDWDSSLNVDADDGVVYSFRGYTEGGFIKTNFKSNNGISVVWSDNSNVNFKQNACSFTNTKLTNAYYRPENEITLPNTINVYVDAVNGSDNNTGFTVNSPVKTLQKAISLAQPGIRTVINLMTDVEHNSYTYVVNKTILIQQYNNAQVKLTLDVTTGGLPSIVLNKSKLNFYVDVDIKNSLLDVNRHVIDDLNSVVHIAYAKDEDGTLRQAKVNIGDYAKIARVNGVFTTWQVDFNFETDNSLLLSILRTAEIGFISSTTTVAGETISADNARISGIITDDNGAYKNVLLTF